MSYKKFTEEKTRRLSLGFEGKELFKMAAKKEDNLEKEKLLAEIEGLRKELKKRKKE